MSERCHWRLAADHPIIGNAAFSCPGCRKGFVGGEVVTFVEIGPGDDEEAQARARAGLPYNAVALVAHFACVTGVVDG